jgi:plastocyanin
MRILFTALICLFISFSFFGQSPGCTDMQACNYNPDATDDDGLCEYPEDGYDCLGNCIIDIDCSGICGGNSFIDDCEECNATSVVSAGLSYPVSLTDQCEIYPISPMYVISVTAVIGATSSATSDAWISLQDASGTTLGSVNAQVSNYQNTSVTVDFEIPIYVSQLQLCSWWNPASLISFEFTGAEGCVSDPGCTVPTASNYDQEATEDDGSCTFNNSCNVDGIEVVTSNYAYSPTDLSVEVGTLVTWSNTDGYHNVNGEINTLTGESFGNPEVFFIDPVSGDETGVCIGSREFNVAGIYSYDCSIGNHAEQGMVATITVGTGGCMDEGSLNYNEAAEFDDGSCEYTINGCTDMQACNYNPDATDDDGLCEYPEDGYDCLGNCIIDIDCSGICGGNSFIDDCEECNATSVVSAGLSYPVSMTSACGSYPISPMYVISVTAVIGASTNTSSNVWIYLQDSTPLNLGSVSATPYNFEITTVTVDFETPIYVSQLQLCSWWNPASLISLELTGAEGCVIVIDPGCTDMAACNYDENATIDDDSCVYDGDDCDDGSEFTENDTYTTDCECLGDEIETCEDGIQNQDETGVDCGGAFCDACPPPPCYGTFVTLTLYDQYSDGGGTVSVNGEDFLVNTGTNTNPTSATYCVDLSTCIEVVYASNDNWPLENSWEITDATTDELLASGGNASAIFGDCILGCTDMQACNYNQEANFNDDSCVYADDACDDGNEFTENDTFTTECECLGDEIEIVPGCTYETACNFNQEANQNDMSCIFPGDDCDDNDESTETDIYNDECECEGEALQGGCTYEAACNYDPEAEFDNNNCLFVGDLCDDDNPNTLDDEIQEDCDCAGTPISTVDELEVLSVLIYPNPTSSNLTVDLGDLNGFITTIKLYDSSSKLVFEKQSLSTLVIDVSNFAKGMYSLELSTDEQVLRSKVIIE